MVLVLALPVFAFGFQQMSIMPVLPQLADDLDGIVPSYGSDASQ